MPDFEIKIIAREHLAAIAEIEKECFSCPWNAELYLDAEMANPPKQCDTPWHWLVPVKPCTDE